MLFCNRVSLVPQQPQPLSTSSYLIDSILILPPSNAFIEPFLFSKLSTGLPINKINSKSLSLTPKRTFCCPDLGFFPLLGFCSRETRMPTASEQASSIPHFGSFDTFCQIGLKKAKDTWFSKTHISYTLPPESFQSPSGSGVLNLACIWRKKGWNSTFDFFSGVPFSFQFFSSCFRLPEAFWESDSYIPSWKNIQVHWSSATLTRKTWDRAQREMQAHVPYATGFSSSHSVLLCP